MFLCFVFVVVIVGDFGLHGRCPPGLQALGHCIFVIAVVVIDDVDVDVDVDVVVVVDDDDDDGGGGGGGGGVVVVVSDQFWFIVITKRYKGGVKTPHHQHSVVAV